MLNLYYNILPLLVAAVVPLLDLPYRPSSLS